jgi:hypothetical protein
MTRSVPSMTSLSVMLGTMAGTANVTISPVWMIRTPF